MLPLDKAVVIIPARYASTRLPGKPLLAETGKPLIQHVVEAVRPAGLVERIVVATDDERIARAVAAFGGEALMTRPDHRCGTDRIAEAAEKLHLADDRIVVNVQGDEPEIPPSCVDRLLGLLAGGDAPMATLITPLPAEQAADPNRVKVVTDAAGRALYFSRAMIPHDRGGPQTRRIASGEPGAGGVRYMLHLGIYAYRVGFLKLFTRLPPAPAELAERLEQLRALEHGYPILTAEVAYDGAGIDTPEDYAAFVARRRATD